ncbi:MAG: Rieske 2Fe-2S domain-containing protein, partial [Caulobacteraceae bacterium]
MLRGAADNQARDAGAKGRDAEGAEGVFGRGFLRGTWYFAALAGDLEAGRIGHFVFLGEPVVMGRTRAGEAFALRDICPHRAAPLSAGKLRREADGGESLECVYHGWRFRTDGVCVAIPSLAPGQGFETGRVRARAYALAESQGLVFIWMANEGATAGEPDRPPPRFAGVVGKRPRLALRTIFNAHIDHAVVGLMDPAHGPFVHQQWWWRSPATRGEKTKRFEPRAEGFAMVRHPPSANSRAYALLAGAPMTEITFRLPGLRWEHVEVGRRQVLALTCLTPVDGARTAVTQIVWSDHPVFALAGPFIRAAARRFLAQDAAMVDLQNEGLKY